MTMQNKAVEDNAYRRHAACFVASLPARAAPAGKRASPLTLAKIILAAVPICDTTVTIEQPPPPHSIRDIQESDTGLNQVGGYRSLTHCSWG